MGVTFLKARGSNLDEFTVLLKLRNIFTAAIAHALL
jgi:hypothetical protein